MNEILLPVPYFSQWRDIFSDDAWRERACGVASAAMAATFILDEPVLPDLVLAEARALTGSLAWTPYGPSHPALCAILRNHGLHAYAEEFRARRFSLETGGFVAAPDLEERSLLRGLAKLASSVREGNPVIVSMAPGFRTSASTHLVLVVGVRGLVATPTAFAVHDPDDRESPGEAVWVSAEEFVAAWRRMAIFVSL